MILSMSWIHRCHKSIGVINPKWPKGWPELPPASPSLSKWKPVMLGVTTKSNVQSKNSARIFFAVSLQATPTVGLIREENPTNWTPLRFHGDACSAEQILGGSQTYCRSKARPNDLTFFLWFFVIWDRWHQWSLGNVWHCTSGVQRSLQTCSNHWQRYACRKFSWRRLSYMMRTWKKIRVF